MRIVGGLKNTTLGLGLVCLAGCAGHQTVHYEKLQLPSEVILRLDNGQILEGVAVEKTGTGLELKTGEQAETRIILLSRIRQIKMSSPIYDERGYLISNREISQSRNSRYTIIYTLGGGFMSFGLGLLGSSIVSRSSDDDFKVLNPISIGSGIAGLLIFNRLGSRRDYRYAIERVKDKRKLYAEKQLEGEQRKKEILQKEIDAVQDEKDRLEREKKQLEEKLKKKKNKPGA